jgi:DNA-3-methyladenine glycosylase I
MPRLGAVSGSCMISVKLTVPSGTWDHSSLGDTGAGTDVVNLEGIRPPSSNAGVDRVNLCFAGDGEACCATAACARSAALRAKSLIFIRPHFLILAHAWINPNSRSRVRQGVPMHVSMQGNAVKEGYRRCPWPQKPLDVAYHDSEWGVPQRDGHILFELLTLEGAQAGLSWSIVLAKRENYRLAFDGFDPERIAAYGARDVRRLLANPGIVRNRLKIAATIGNARAFLAVQRETGSFGRYLWSFVGGNPRVNRRRSMGDVPARTAQSDAMSKDLRARGFKFVGTTICYALMQASGMVNDHLVSCPRHAECSSAEDR